MTVWTLYLLLLTASGEHRTVEIRGIEAPTQAACTAQAQVTAAQQVRDGETLQSWACIEGEGA